MTAPENILRDAARTLDDRDLLMALDLAREQVASCRAADLTPLLSLKEAILMGELDRRRIASPKR
ncbi:hypothetical protein [Arenibaculum pallidiluteum]|uniref:hypothetical protein n=1 Tax=Arenibaculum pallidiluteum TaxID=2812559 RepID=UPI001A962029|nr:hypothetical protein [Arenibaculum pallidiluteum]